METERLTIELKRAINNWYHAPDDMGPFSVFNALKRAMDQDMDIIVPIETPVEWLEALGDVEQLKAGDTFTSDKEIRLQFRRLPAQEPDQFMIPLFTDQTEMEKGQGSSQINQGIRRMMEAVLDWEGCAGVVLNPWNRKLVLNKQIIRDLLDFSPRSHINVIKGSVVHTQAGAIVNAANHSLLGGGGVDGAIHKAAGPQLRKACSKLGGCRTGEAKITKAFNIKHSDFIIHTVGPVYSGSKQEASELASCYIQSMDFALQHGCNSIAFPGISTGVYGYPLDQATGIALITVTKWLQAHPQTVMDVYFVNFTDQEQQAYRKILDE